MENKTTKEKRKINKRIFFLFSLSTLSLFVCLCVSRFRPTEERAKPTWEPVTLGSFNIEMRLRWMFHYLCRSISTNSSNSSAADAADAADASSSVGGNSRGSRRTGQKTQTQQLVVTTHNDQTRQTERERETEKETGKNKGKTKQKVDWEKRSQQNQEGEIERQEERLYSLRVSFLFWETTLALWSASLFIICARFWFKPSSLHS